MESERKLISILFSAILERCVEHVVWIQRNTIQQMPIIKHINTLI